MGIAFRTDSVLGVVVGEQEQVTVDDLFVGQFEWVCGAVQGQVFCNTDPAGPTPLPCALVKAVEVLPPDSTETPDEFLGITDDNGFYAICVPPGTYDIMVLCCDSECCEPVACGCGCGCENGDDNGEG